MPRVHGCTGAAIYMDGLMPCRTRLQGWRRYGYKEVTGTTPRMGEVELCLEQQSRVESGMETESIVRKREAYPWGANAEESVAISR